MNPPAKGLRLPTDSQICRAIADFEPHRQSWILWPVRPDNWRESAAPAQATFGELVRILVEDEPLTVGAPADALEQLQGVLPVGTRLFGMEYDDVWIRDTGPVFIEKDGEILGVDWRFNSWGGSEHALFGTWDKDDSVAQQLLNLESLPSIRSSVVLEGGAIATDGRGTLITTRECLINPNRNPSMTENDYERLFAEMLGIRRVIWLDEGLAHDEAGGHIDNLAAFLGVAKLLVADPASAPRSQRQRLESALSNLRSAGDADGNAFELILVPLPNAIAISESEAAGFAPSDGTIQRQAGTLMVASYINFVFTNKRVLIPLFDDPLDEVAIGIIRDAAHSRGVHGLASRELVIGGGALHCVVLHQPNLTTGE